MEIKNKVIATTFAGAIAAAAAFIGPEEGISMKAYQDSVKIWTICRGHTGPEVKKGLVLTNAACETLFRTDIWKAMQVVLDTTQGVTLPEPVLVSFTSFTFNVGGQKFKTSTARSLLVQGKFEDACHQLPRWKFAGGQDCSVRDNNCYGVWQRRLREEAYCMSAFP
jgi:lysozyme